MPVMRLDLTGWTMEWNPIGQKTGLLPITDKKTGDEFGFNTSQAN